MENKLRFVVHEHIRSGHPRHWDLMLEQSPCVPSTEYNATLETFRLPCPAAELRKNTIIITKIMDHPIRFLSYEGAVNNGEGNVKIIARGEYEKLSEDAGHMMLSFHGDNLSGKYQLEYSEGDCWKLTSIN